MPALTASTGRRLRGAISRQAADTSTSLEDNCLSKILVYAYLADRDHLKPVGASIPVRPSCRILPCLLPHHLALDATRPRHCRRWSRICSLCHGCNLPRTVPLQHTTQSRLTALVVRHQDDHHSFEAISPTLQSLQHINKREDRPAETISLCAEQELASEKDTRGNDLRRPLLLTAG